MANGEKKVTECILRMDHKGICTKGSTKQARKITKEIDVINVTVKQLPEWQDKMLFKSEAAKLKVQKILAILAWFKNWLYTETLPV